MSRGPAPFLQTGDLLGKPCCDSNDSSILEPRFRIGIQRVTPLIRLIAAAAKRPRKGLIAAYLAVYMVSVSALPLGAARSGCCCSGEARAAGICCCSSPPADATSDLPPCCQARAAQSRAAMCCRTRAGATDEPLDPNGAVRRCGCNDPADHGVCFHGDPRLALTQVQLTGNVQKSLLSLLPISQRMNWRVSPPTPPPRLAA